MTRLCLNMIVRNEVANLERCLSSIVGHIACWVIVDTGSSDGTQALIRRFFDSHAVPGELHSAPFENFSQARNAALDLARASSLSFDYLLFADADMELTVADAQFARRLTAQAYQLRQTSSEIAYWNLRLLRRDADARYVGVTHEYLALGSGETRPLETAAFIDHASGANRAGKFARDAALLTKALESETDAALRARYTFYLANSLRDDGDREGALQRYWERSRLGHWPEEVFVSLLNAAKLQIALGASTEEALATFEAATAACPTRAEALHGAARLCRDKQLYEQGYRFAARGAAIPLPRNALFVAEWIYAYGLLDELAIAAYWTGRYAESLAACERLLADPRLPDDQRARVLRNKQSAEDRLREQPEPAIPRILHFITGLDRNFGGKRFSFIHAMAILSALRVNAGFVARVYFEYEPDGPYWELIKPHVICVRIVAPREFAGRPIEHFAHAADVVRLQVLLEHGGVYLDLDTICQRPFAPLLEGAVVMGLEKTSDGATIGLCNATIIAPPGAEFLKIWLQSYDDFKIWNRFSVQLPMRLAEENPGLVRIEPNTSFFWPSWDDAGLAALFLKDHAYPEAYSFHLWEAKSWEHAKSLDAGRVRTIDTTYNHVARRFAGELELPEPSDAAHTKKALVQTFRQIHERSQGAYLGSTLRNTIEYRAFVERFIRANQVRAVTDLGCGDWRFSRAMDWSGVTYKGLDVVAEIIEANRANYAAENVSFELFEEIERLPGGDLLLAKDVLQHLPTYLVREYIAAIRQKYRFALITNTIEPASAANTEIDIGGYRPLRLDEAPFHTPGANVFHHQAQNGETSYMNATYLVLGKER